MEEFYDENRLKQIDSIIDILSQEKMMRGVTSLKTCYGILEKENWIETIRNEQGEVIVATPSKTFDALLAGGKFSERYKRKRESATSKNYFINNSYSPYSTFAVGENITQTVHIQTSIIDEAIKQIKEADSLDTNEKNEIIDCLQELRDAYSQNQQPVKSTLRGLARWSDKLLSLGGSICSVYSTIMPILQPYLGA